MYTSDDINIYKLYVESSDTLHPDVQEALDRIEIIDGRKVIPGDVHLTSFALKSLPFHGVHVTGDFYCYHHHQLTTLHGAPSSVGGYFNCADSKLPTLEGAPTSVGGDFICSGNKLPNLKGVPTSVGGDFDCCSNQLTTLEGAPTSVRGWFYCFDNQLTSLQGAPTSVDGAFVFNEPITIKQVAAANIHAQKFIYASQDDMNGTLLYDYERDFYHKDVTKEVERERYNITLTSELSDVEDAINIADIDF